MDCTFVWVWEYGKRLFLIYFNSINITYPFNTNKNSNTDQSELVLNYITIPFINTLLNKDS